MYITLGYHSDSPRAATEAYKTARRDPAARIVKPQESGKDSCYRRGMLDYDLDDDLPWDGLWEYVLGEDESDNDTTSRQRSSSFRRYQSDDTSTDLMTDFLSTEDPISTSPIDVNRRSSGSETKRRLSFPRPSSFNRQVSHQSTSTTGSNSSFRLKSILTRGKKTEEDKELHTSSSFEFVSSEILGAMEGEPESLEIVATSPKKEKRKRFWKKKDDQDTTQSSSEFLIAFPSSNGTNEINTESPKREKRKLFGKKKEEKDPAPTQTVSVFSAIASALDAGGEETQEVHTPNREKRKSFWKRTSSKASDEDRSDMESIEAMLGPWEGRSQPEETAGKWNEAGSSKKSTKQNFGHHSEDNKTETTTKRPHRASIKQLPSEADTTLCPETRPRQSIMKAVTRFAGKTVNKHTMSGSQDKTQPDSKKLIRCGQKATDDVAPFYNNPVFLSSFSEDSSSKEPVSILKKTSHSKSKNTMKHEENQDEQIPSFLPQTLLSCHKEVDVVQKSESTEAANANEALKTLTPLDQTNSTLSATSISVNSSVSGFSEAGQCKKSVKWADEFHSSDQDSAVARDTFAGIRKVLDPSWLYGVSSSDSDSSMTSSANRSAQSEDLSSVQTESDISMGNASSSDKGDSSDKEGQQEALLRHSQGNFTDRFNQLPPIDENASFRSSLGDDGYDTLNANLKYDESSSPTEAGTSNSITESDGTGVHTKFSVRKRKDGEDGEMTTIEPVVDEAKSSEKKPERSVDIDALILGMNAKLRSDSVPEQKMTTQITSKATRKSSPTNPKSLVDGINDTKSNQERSSTCVLAMPKKSPDYWFPSCRVLRNLSDDELVQAMESGIPVHELTMEELAEIFPKIRMVADDRQTDHASLVLGNANSFDDSRPALLQVPSKAIKPALGLQSLYEYDFASGKHMTVSYDSCGSDPRSSLMVITHGDPPVSKGPEFAVIQVEASTISNTDCRTRRDGWFGNKRVELPNIPGVDVVGKIYRIDFDSSKQTGLKKGDRVFSLVSQGGNSRFVTLDPASLVRVPEKVDPAEAACLVETYLTAFQTLHYNQSFLTRYRKNALRGKSILVIGGMSANMSRAMSQLAQQAGTKALFATGRKKDFKQLSEQGILPLTTDPLTWWEQLAGAIDVLISLDEEVIPLHHKLLKNDGTLVVSSSEFREDLMNEEARDPLKRTLACSTSKARASSRTSHYDLYEEWENSRAKAKKDLSHLAELLEDRRIVPTVLDRVPLGEVAKIQETLEKRRAKGHYVCEPWLVSKSRAVSL